LVALVIAGVQASWVSGVNKRFENVARSEIKKLMGALPTPPGQELASKQYSVVALPDSFDSRTNWPKCPSISHIRDQANCGSCWAFGAAEAWSDRVCIGSNGDVTDPMSSADMLSCCSYSCGYGCEGGFLSGAWSYIMSDGLVTGEDFGENQYCSPYPLAECEHHVNGTKPPCPATVPTPACETTCKNGKDYKQDKHKASKIYAVTGESNMMNEIMTHGPIEAAFTVYDDFLTYKSGVYQHTSGAYLGGHAIRVLGWGVEQGKKYWLVANSWNEDWGDKGYFKILKGTNECGIEGQGYAGVL
jgi:cathepsin B